MSESGFFLEGRRLVKVFPGVLAVDRVDFGVHPGEIVGLVGKNGAGKSTLIKILAGAHTPDEGEIVLDGRPVVLHSPRDALALGLSFVHQELSDVPNLSVAENVMLGLGYPRRLGAFVDWRSLQRDARAVLDRIGAPIQPTARVDSLSAVQQRLVMIAHALARRARLLVLDEPSAALTAEEIDHLYGVIRTLKEEGVAIIYVSHRLDEIFEITERVVVMRDGRVVADAPTAALDRRALITHITGTTGGRTAVERRRLRGVGPPPETEEILRVEGLRIPGATGTCGFSLRAGEVLGLAGLVGSGRTELVRIVAGADRPSSGRVLVRGADVTPGSPRDALRAGIILIPEERRTQGMVLGFSVRKNVTLPTLPAHRLVPALPIPSPRSERQTTHEMVERLSIRASHVDQPVDWLSGGNQQKVVLAKWLLRGGNVFIFDEPTLGIDVEAKEEIYDLIEQLARAGKGVIFISSEFAELVGVCNRVLVLREGRLVGELVGDDITEPTIVELCYAAPAELALDGSRAEP